jgi:hypothetical protein
MGPEERIPTKIIWRLVQVLAAIKLDNERGLKADEVTNIDAKWMLPSEFEATQLAPT